MQHWLSLFILLPLFTFGASLWFSRRQERWLSGLAVGGSAIHLSGQLILLATWWSAGMPDWEMKVLVLYHSAHFEFAIDFFYDKITAVFAFSGALLTLLVAVFSKYYMHREPGFRRFFTTLLLFFTGYNLLVFSGNFETLFTGWEILGITSFLLIAFYRDRYLPVRNAYKVLTFYRLGDIGLMLAMWMSHHIWHRNILFSEWTTDMVSEQMSTHYGAMMFLIGMLVMAAAIKSAQFPFFTWLPRAMEGPTSSSAIFYGSLSVHIGVFVLLRTAPLWETEWLPRAAIIVTGVVTSLMVTGISRVQTSVKTRIAYASVVQLGVMFIEIGLGFYTLALVHFMGNAFLRTYQLLVSPSILSYKIHDMFFHFDPNGGQGSRSRLSRALYVLSVREWHFDTILKRSLWQPFKWGGSHVSGKFTAGFVLLIAGYQWWTGSQFTTGAGWLMLVSLMLVLQSFAWRGDARRAWLTIVTGQVFLALSIWSNNESAHLHQLLWFISGPLIAAVVGAVILNKLYATDGNLAMNQYHGYSHIMPGSALIFLLAALGLSGFPITPTFIGIDLMFTHIGSAQKTMVVLAGLVFLFTELAVLRLYARLFMGPYKKMTHPVAFRSS